MSPVLCTFDAGQLSEHKSPRVYMSHFASCRYEAAQLNGHKSPLPDISELPPSRPLTPSEQMDIMLAIEQEELEATGIPSERDEEVRGLDTAMHQFQCHHRKFFI